MSIQQLHQASERIAENAERHLRGAFRSARAELRWRELRRETDAEIRAAIAEAFIVRGRMA